jgi:hypothetical protein
MATIAALDAERIDALATRFSGALLRPGDAGFEDARKVHNGLIDKRPGLIARCRGPLPTSSTRSHSPVRRGSRSPSAAAATTSPAWRSPTAA